MKIKAFLVVSSLVAVTLAFSEWQPIPYSNVLTADSLSCSLGNWTTSRNLSHVVGVWMKPSSPFAIGPDTGSAPTSPNTWTLQVQSSPVPDTKFLMLHFAGVSLPG